MIVSPRRVLRQVHFKNRVNGEENDDHFLIILGFLVQILYLAVLERIPSICTASKTGESTKIIIKWYLLFSLKYFISRYAQI